MYKNLVENSKELNKFLDLLDQDEQYYVSILSRRKYHSSAESDANQHFRFISKPEYIENNLKAINPELFINKKGSLIHTDALAVYIGINPIDKKKAQRILLKNLVDKALDENNTQSPLDLAFTALHKSIKKLNYIDLDFDLDDDYNINDPKENVFNHCNNYLIEPIFIETRGGIHCLIKPGKQRKSWYKEVSNHKYFDTTNKHIIPMPGSIQSTYSPKIIDLNL